MQKPKKKNWKMKRKKGNMIDIGANKLQLWFVTFVYEESSDSKRPTTIKNEQLCDTILSKRIEDFWPWIGFSILVRGNRMMLNEKSVMCASECQDNRGKIDWI